VLDLLDLCGGSNLPLTTCFLLPPLLFPLPSLSSSVLLSSLSPSLNLPSIILYHTLRDDSDGATQLLVTVSTGARAAVSATVLQEVTAAEQVIYPLPPPTSSCPPLSRCLAARIIFARARVICRAQGVPNYMQLQEEGIYPFPAPVWSASGTGWSAVAMATPVSLFHPQLRARALHSQYVCF
jgi:hypothetical protein